MLEEDVKDNYYVRIHTGSMKCRTREHGHSMCFKSMSRTTTLQGFTLTAITAGQKHTLT